MKSWTAAINDIKDVPEKTVRGTLLSLGSNIIKGSPVDTGRFRGNWQFSSNSPARGTSANTTPPFPELMAAGRAFEMGDVFYITNNLPYAERLEYGWSNQAPNGIVRTTLSRYQEILTIEASKV